MRPPPRRPPAVAALGHVVGDNDRDLAISDATANSGAGQVTVLSGGSGITLRMVAGNPQTERGLGASMANIASPIASP